MVQVLGWASMHGRMRDAACIGPWMVLWREDLTSSNDETCNSMLGQDRTRQCTTGRVTRNSVVVYSYLFSMMIPYLDTLRPRSDTVFVADVPRDA